ncbi:MAG: hypothetical protein RL150_586 [Candidatus Parcubacteria bacterium]|jgi:hypothetical protein
MNFKQAMLPYFKKGVTAFCVASLLFVQGVAVLHAQEAPVSPEQQNIQGGGGYQSISGVNFGGSLPQMLAQLFKWLVSITIILAVIMLVVGGVQYMGTESLFGKSEGKDRITAALGGLAIALVCIYVLNLILGTGGPGDFIVDLGF